MGIIQGRTSSTDSPKELPSTREMCYTYQQGVSQIMNLLEQHTALVDDYSIVSDYGADASTILNNADIACDQGSFLWQLAHTIQGGHS